MTANKLRLHLVPLIQYLLIGTLAFGLCVYPAQTAAAAGEAIGLCVNVLIPSLFPFFVVSSLAVHTGLAALLGRLFERPMQTLFAVPGACAPAFILGLVGGYPVGAKTAITLFQQNLCSKTQAERLLAFCNNSGPAFILGAVGASIFGTTMAGVLLYTAHILASVVVGLLFRCYRRRGDAHRESGRFQVSVVPFRRAVTESVTSSFSSALNICAFVIFFAVFIKLLHLLGVIPYTAALLGGIFNLDALYLQNLLSGFFEVTTGLYGLSGTAISFGLKLSTAAFMLGWAGLSVHFQVLNFIGQSGLSPLPYVWGKLLHGVVSAAFTLLGTHLLPFDAQVDRLIIAQTTALSQMGAAQSFLLSLGTVVAVWGLCLLVYTVFYCKTRKKKL